MFRAVTRRAAAATTAAPLPIGAMIATRALLSEWESTLVDEAPIAAVRAPSDEGDAAKKEWCDIMSDAPPTTTEVHTTPAQGTTSPAQGGTHKFENVISS
jgi:hypothetical protein